MYRGPTPSFCRQCGARWTPGAAACSECGEPVQARAEGVAFGRALPEFVDQRRALVLLTLLVILYGLALGIEGDLLWGTRTSILEDDWSRIDSTMQLFSFGHIALASLPYLALVIVFGRWLIRAGRNLRARAILDTREVDEGRLLWFFVPVVHLYRPLLGIAELCKASAADDPQAWRSERAPWGLLSVWWALWLGSNLAGNAALYLYYHGTDPLIAVESDLWRVGLRLACIPFFLALVVRIDRAQRAHRPGAH